MKLGGQLWTSGVAAYYALQLEHTFGRAWAYPIATNTWLATLIAYGTLLVEVAFLPLVAVPSRITRLVAIAVAAGLHGGILVLMNVGDFPVIMLSALVLFVPPGWTLRAMGAAVTTTRARLEPRALALADGAARDAARVAAPPALAVPMDVVDRRADGVALTVLAGLAFLTAVPSQLEAVRPTGDLATLLRFLLIDQRWDMFSPEPARADGWLRMPATLADGTRLDLLTGGPADDRSERYSDPTRAG